MTHGLISTFLLAAISIALIGSIECGAGPSKVNRPPKLPSLDIKSPYMFRKFRAGHFDGFYDEINVKKGAHPDILSQIYWFKSSDTPKIRFTDDNDNTVELATNKKRVTVENNNGRVPLEYLPSNYKSYELNMGEKATPTVTDAETIKKWKSAEELKVTPQAEGQNAGFWARYKAWWNPNNFKKPNYDYKREWFLQ